MIMHTQFISPHQPGMVLIVDDMPVNIMMLRHILKTAGYQCQAVSRGEDVLPALEANAYDLVLLDIMMPGISGYEICQMIKQQPRFEEIPVIFVTAKDDPNSVVKGLEAGAVDYIAKPFNPTELLARVRTQLRLRQSEQVLREREAQLRIFFDNIDDLICFCALDGAPLAANRAYTELTGLTEKQLIADPRAWLNIVHPEDQSKLIAFFAAFPQGPARQDIEYRQRAKTGAWRWIHMHVAGIPSASGYLGYHCVGRDFTMFKRQTEDRLLQASTVFEHTSEAIVITDCQQRIVAVNPAFTLITGYNEEEVLGKTPGLLQSNQYPPHFYQQIWTTIHRAGFWQGEIIHRRNNDELFPAWQNITAVRDSNGEIAHYISMFTDTTAQKASEEKIRYLADYDTLTGLPNHTQFKKQVDEALLDQDGNLLMAVFLLDLDRFKQINDTLGHAIGDSVLQAVALRLQGELAMVQRTPPMLARMSGDMFTIFLPECKDIQQITQMAEHLQQAMRPPIHIENHTLYISASQGIAISPHDGKDTAALLKNAEIAMYQAKYRSGRGHYQFYTAQFGTGAFEAMRLENELRAALEQRQLFLVYQPQVDLSSREVIGAEALLRWQHPELGVISPDRIIPLAEETGLIIPIGEWVLQTACAQARQWREKYANFNIAVNLSSLQLQHEGIVATIRATLKNTGLPPQCLELELTESVIMQENEASQTTLNELRALGVKLAVDDFGTGYSSLAYLRRLPIDKLKIDRSFIEDLHEDANALAIASSVIALGKTLQLHVIAEGIENEQQQQILQSQGCDSGQGYLYSRPLCAEELTARLSVCTRM